MLKTSQKFFSTAIKTSGDKTVSCPTQLLINGKWQDAASGHTFDTLDPATDKLITKVAKAGAKDVDLAVQAAHDALYGPWAKVSHAQRAVLINRYADELLKHKEELVHLEGTDNGKPAMMASKDVLFAASIFRYNAGAAERLGGDSFQRENGYGFVRREPRVAGCITPWNFPLLMTTFKMAPLLASGSCGLFKVPDLAPLSSLKMAEIWTNMEGSVPGVINMLPGDGEAGESIVDHEKVGSIHFTGSTAIGQRIMQRAAPTCKRTFLELGGKAPFIVFDDANLEKAIQIGAVFGSVNTGQFCGQPSRFYIHEKVHDQFVEKMCAILKHQKYGRWDEEGIWGGPVISARQADKIMGYIKSGVEQGATLVTGGKRIDRPGNFIQPTVFTDCTHEMKIVQEEIFGPVLSVMKFSDVDEVIAKANDTKYGLVGAVFSESQKTCNKVARELQIGKISINNYFMIGVDSPFGGFKQSGIGREMGRGVENYLEAKTIIYDCS